MAQYSAIEFEYKLAVAKFESFVEFTSTIAGDEIPDDLYNVATEIFGGDLAKSIGAGIVALAKKIWDLVVRIITWIGDIVSRIYKRIILDTGQLKKLDGLLAADREKYDYNLKNLTRFVPKKSEFISVQENLAILYSYNSKLIKIIQDQNMDLREFTGAVSYLHCSIQGVTNNSNNTDEMKLIVIDTIRNQNVEWNKDIYTAVLINSMDIGNVAKGADWTTYDLQAAISAVINANNQGIRANSMNVLANAKQTAKQWLDEVQNIDPNATQEEVDKARKLAVYAGDMVKLISNIYQLELVTTSISTNIVSRMAAYAISPGTLNLDDISTSVKGANNASVNPLLGLKLFSVI